MKVSRNVLLHGEIPVSHGGHRIAQRRQMVDGFRDTEVSDVVGRGLGAEQQVIADVLFNGAVAVVAADDGIREVEIFNQRFALAAVPLDVREFRGLTNRAIRIEQAFAQGVQGDSRVEDEVVRVTRPARRTADADSSPAAARSA
jgi:hypothetical protein